MFFGKPCRCFQNIIWRECAQMNFVHIFRPDNSKNKHFRDPKNNWHNFGKEDPMTVIWTLIHWHIDNWIYKEIIHFICLNLQKSKIRHTRMPKQGAFKDFWHEKQGKYKGLVGEYSPLYCIPKEFCIYVVHLDIYVHKQSSRFSTTPTPSNSPCPSTLHLQGYLIGWDK